MFRNLFKRPSDDRVAGTRILIACLGSKFSELMAADSSCYARFYKTPKTLSIESGEELLQAIEGGFDIVHLFCDVTPNGNLVDSREKETPGSLVLERCAKSDVKVLWLASDNSSAAYMNGFKGGRPINLVLTLERRESKFATFLEQLLNRMSAGQTMPTAWVSLASQTSTDPRHQNLPACIFSAGRAGVRLQ